MTPRHPFPTSPEAPMPIDEFIDGCIRFTLATRAAEQGDGVVDLAAPLLARVTRDHLKAARPFLSDALATSLTVEEFVDGFIAFQEQGRAKSSRARRRARRCPPRRPHPPATRSHPPLSRDRVRAPARPCLAGA